MGVWNNIIGTTSAFFKIGLSGVRLKNNSGDLSVRNTDDSADAAVTASTVNVSGDNLTLNSDSTGSGGDYKMVIQRPATGMTSDVTLTLPVDDGSPGQAFVTDGSGNLSWQTLGQTSQNTSVDTTTINFDTVSPAAMFTLPPNAVIYEINVILDTPFDGTAPTASVGIDGELSKYMGSGSLDLKGMSGDIFTTFPSQPASAPAEDLIITFAADGSSAGSARLLVKYSVPA